MLKSLFAGFVCLYFLTPIAYAAEIYEWRDAQGEEHMADTPPPPDQAGVELLRVNGTDVNTFHAEASAEPPAATVAPGRQPAAPRVSADAADCEEIHGRPCNWDNQWRSYAEANCRRVGDGHGGNDAHLRAHHDPRVHAQHHAAHAHAHR